MGLHASELRLWKGWEVLTRGLWRLHDLRSLGAQLYVEIKQVYSPIIL
jgi:hypothetical protein